jgi:hypothetical protein
MGIQNYEVDFVLVRWADTWKNEIVELKTN